MAKTVPTVVQLPIPGVTNNYIYTGNPVFIFVAGTDMYGKLRLNQEVELVLDDGSKRKAIVQSRTVAPLIDLIVSNGSQSVQAAGRVYSASSLVQVLTEQVPEDVLDVTLLYTAVQIVVQAEQVPMSPSPSA